jgi:hypothetical protein
MEKSLVASILFFVVIACKSQDVKLDLIAKLEDCRERYDKSTTQQMMVGRWKLIATGCGECEMPGIHETNKNFTITITKENKIFTYEDELLIRTSNFDVVNFTNDGGYKLETNPRFENLYTNGLILFCKDIIIFSGSAFDGPDYYFEKIK